MGVASGGFTWKAAGLTSCTECGRVIACPAWPPRAAVAQADDHDLRDHAYAKAPYLQAAEEARAGLPEALRAEAGRPLVGPIQAADGLAGVIDPDVLWSCTSCGACVEQCPVDIEHLDHIMDLRRYQVQMESDFPPELNGLFKGLETRATRGRRVRAAGWSGRRSLTSPCRWSGGCRGPTEVEYLFWVGCAGAYDDRAKKTTRAVVELLRTAGGCTRCSATARPAPATRRGGGQRVRLQQLALENAETLTEAKATKVVTACAHCLNTLKNEYPQSREPRGRHPHQLLNRLVRDGRLTPVAAVDGAVAGRTVTFHDPCYLGRHTRFTTRPGS